MNDLMRLGILAGIIAAGCVLGADQPGINDLPDIKEGLWESSTMIHGSMDKPMPTTMCTSNAVNRKIYEDTHKNPNRSCKQTHSERHGSLITEEIECNFSGKVTHSKTVTMLTGNTARLGSLIRAGHDLSGLAGASGQI